MNPRKQISEVGKWILTARTVYQNIPGCDDSLGEIYEEAYCHSDWNDDYDLPEIKEKIKKEFENWLQKSNDIKILVKLLYLEKNFLPTFLKLKSLVDIQYKSYFNSIPKNIPALMARPMVPFFPVSKRAGSMIQIDKPIIKKSGKTKMIIRGTVAQARDLKTVHALINLMKRKEISTFQEDIIYFKASLEEICKEMNVGNPSASDPQEAIFRSLVRLRKCTIIWEWKSDQGRAHWKIGGILAKAKTLEETSGGELGIFFDMDFFRLYQYGYLNINDEVFYALKKDMDILLYVYLLGQPEFNTKGRLGGKRGINLFGVYEHANLEGLVKLPKSKATKRYEINQSLMRLKTHGAIRGYRIKNDALKVFT